MIKRYGLQSIEKTADYLGLCVSSLNNIRLDSDLNFPKKVKLGNRVMFNGEQVIEQEENRIEMVNL